MQSPLLILLCLLASCPALSQQVTNEGNGRIDTTLVKHWSSFYKNWYYYPDYVVSASLENDLNFAMVDGPVVFRSGHEWHMQYFGYDDRGYQSCLAVSDDLIHWKPGGLLMGFGEAGTFDHGGVVLVGPLFDGYDVHKAPRLKTWRGAHWILYGCYPVQGGYELGHGGQGLARSEDGLTWKRFSKDDPILSVNGAAEWESRVIYSPYLLEHDGKFWNFYNAKGETGREQIGFAISEDLVHWKRHKQNPVIRNSSDGYDAHCGNCQGHMGQGSLGDVLFWCIKKQRRQSRSCSHHDGVFHRPDPLDEKSRANLQGRRTSGRSGQHACS